MNEIAIGPSTCVTPERHQNSNASPEYHQESSRANSGSKRQSQLTSTTMKMPRPVTNVDFSRKQQLRLPVSGLSSSQVPKSLAAPLYPNHKRSTSCGSDYQKNNVQGSSNVIRFTYSHKHNKPSQSKGANSDSAVPQVLICRLEQRRVHQPILGKIRAPVNKRPVKSQLQLQKD